MKLWTLIGEQTVQFTTDGSDTVHEVEKIKTNTGYELSLDTEVEPYFNAEQLEIKRLLEIIQKRDAELKKYKIPKERIRMDVGIRNEIMDMRYYNPQMTGTLIASKLNMPGSTVSKILSGNHSVCTQVPVWTKPEQ